jgi:hypothetical protein
MHREVAALLATPSQSCDATAPSLPNWRAGHFEAADEAVQDRSSDFSPAMTRRPSPSTASACT